MNKLDPKSVGLTSRDRVVAPSSDRLALVIDRKSRIIMADGRRIMEKIGRIKSIRPDARVSVMTDTAMCSKTRIFLQEHGVEVMPIIQN